MKTVREIMKDVYGFYEKKGIPYASAAMAYYLTMSIFPLVICLYTLFGQTEEAAMLVYEYIEQFLTTSAADLIKSFLLDLSGRSSSLVLVAAIVTLLMSGAAAIRLLQSTIGDMQGGRRFRATVDYMISFALALAVLLAVYFSIIVLLAGYRFVNWIDRNMGIKLADSSWLWFRFIVLGGIAFAMLWSLFAFTRQKNDRYPVLPGVMSATVGIVVTGGVFSQLISSSSRYSLVYGTLASVILVLCWLNLMFQVIFLGAALNIALRDRRARLEKADVEVIAR